MFANFFLSLLILAVLVTAFAPAQQSDLNSTALGPIKRGGKVRVKRKESPTGTTWSETLLPPTSQELSPDTRSRFDSIASTTYSAGVNTNNFAFDELKEVPT